MKHISRVLGVLVVVSSSVLAMPPSDTSASPSSASPTVFKIGAIDVDGLPAGCLMNCQIPQSKVPGFARQDNFQNSLSDASKVDVISGYSYGDYIDRRGCAIVTNGALRCWGSNEYGQLGDGTTNHSPNALVWAMDGTQRMVDVTDVSVAEFATCVVISQRVKCVGYGFRNSENYPPKFSSTSWVDLELSDVTKVVIGQNTVKSGTNTSSIPVCGLTSFGEVKCSYLDSPGAVFVSDIKGVTDLSLLGNSSMGIFLCVAGAETACIEFSIGIFKKSTTFSGIDSSSAVYIPHLLNVVCFYSGDTLFCENFRLGNVRLFPMGVMQQPLSIFMAPGPYRTGMMVLLPDQVLNVEATRFTCACINNTPPQISKVAVFNESTFDTYFSINRTAAVTNSPNVISLVVESGIRNVRTLAPIRVLTTSGVPLGNVNFKWTAPDLTGSLRSSVNNSITTAADGNARSTLATGPVTFELSGGTVPNGAVLQAASITVFVAPTGTTTVTVPDPPAMIDRTVTVLNSDGSPIPDAQIAIRNQLIHFAYTNSTAAASRWSSRAPDFSGNFGQMGCVYCYVQLPTYVTGSNGSVNFKSFAPTQRFSKFDVNVSYDDGEIYMNLGANLSGASSVIYMPFLPRIEIGAPDSDPTTSAIDIPVGKNGKIDVEFRVQNENSYPVNGFNAVAESVCGTMETGGLLSLGARNSFSCENTRAFSLGTGVRAMGCANTTHTTTGSTGTATLTFCDASSTKYRIRGTGAIASRVICIVVDRKQCGASSTPLSLAGKAAPATTKVETKHVRRGSRSSLNKLIKPTVGAKVTWSVSGGCTVNANTLVTPKKAATCKLVIKQVVTTRTNVKGKNVTRTAATTKQVTIKVT